MMSKVEKVLVEVDTLIMYAGWADDANCRHLYAHINNLVSQKIKEQKENPILDPWEPNTSSDYDMSIHSNPDAKVWADFFINTFPGLADKHDLMHAWFANAMMAMYDHLLSKQQKQEAEPVEFDWPEYHAQGMGCGLEDRCITDRYEAMRYGWDCAMERVAEMLENCGPLYTAPQAQPAPTNKEQGDE